MLNPAPLGGAEESARSKGTFAPSPQGGWRLLDSRHRPCSGKVLTQQNNPPETSQASEPSYAARRTWRGKAEDCRVPVANRMAFVRLGVECAQSDTANYLSVEPRAGGSSA